MGCEMSDYNFFYDDAQGELSGKLIIANDEDSAWEKWNDWNCNNFSVRLILLNVQDSSIIFQQ